MQTVMLMKKQYFKFSNMKFFIKIKIIEARKGEGDILKYPVGVICITWVKKQRIGKS